MVIGIAGKIGSGKTMLANKLRVWLDAVVFSFAGGLKGLVSRYEVGGYFPQFYDGWRRELQVVGMLGRMVEDDLWIKVLESALIGLDGENIVISDVRFKNELEFIKMRGGIVVYLRGGGSGVDYIDRDVSEKLDEVLCDYVFDSVGEAEEFFIREFGIARKPVLYVGGNIYRAKQYELRIRGVANELRKLGIEVLLPEFESDGIKQFIEDVNAISRVDGGVFSLTGPSFGVGVEVTLLKVMEKPVWFISNLKHEWLRFLSMGVGDLTEIEKKIKEFWRL